MERGMTGRQGSGERATTEASVGGFLQNYLDFSLPCASNAIWSAGLFYKS
jgi:hypothetical protein